MFRRAGCLCIAMTHQLRLLGCVTVRDLHHVRHISRFVVNMNKDGQTHYDVLGVPTSASQTQIRDAFLRLSKEVHPDLNRGAPDSKDKFLRLRDAYSVLSSSESRREYDVLLLKTRRARGQSFSSEFTGSFVPPKQSYYRQNTSSKRHAEQKPKQQHREPESTEKDDHYRLFNMFSEWLEHAKVHRQQKSKEHHKNSESTKRDDVHRGFFVRLLDTLQSSFRYRPSTTFFPVAAAVLMIYACVMSVGGVLTLYSGSRIDRNREAASKRRLQESSNSDEGS